MAQQRENRPGDGQAEKRAAEQAAARQQAPQPEHRTPTAAEKEHSSVPKLVRQLTSDVTSLFTKEISLARSEMRESVQEAKAGVVAMTGGGVVLLAGLIVLLMAGVYGLATVWPLWLSALVVGGVVAIIGAVMLKSGQSKIQPKSFKPERTIHEMEKDRESIQSRRH